MVSKVYTYIYIYVYVHIQAARIEMNQFKNRTKWKKGQKLTLVGAQKCHCILPVLKWHYHENRR